MDLGDQIKETAIIATKEFDLHPLFEVCCSTPDIVVYKHHIYALHHTCYEDFVGHRQICGQILSSSLLTFVLMAHTHVGLDDPRKVSDFPLLTIHKDWLHLGDQPVSRMSQQTAVDALLGLEWLVFSELFGEPRTEAWIQQARALYGLLQNRIFVFVQSGGESLEVLDMEKYRTKHKRGLFAAVNTAEFDYASDDEQFKKKKLIAPVDLTTRDLEYATVNTVFLFDMDAIITHFQYQWYLHDLTKPIIAPAGPQPNVSVFRGWLFSVITKLNATQVIKARRTWQETLQMAPPYERIYLRENGFGSKVAARHVILLKNEKVAEMGVCVSVDDITTRTIKKTEIMLRLATDSMFSFWAVQNDNVFAVLIPDTIYRDRIRDVWLVHIGGSLLPCSSFTHAFRVLRVSMGAEKVMKKVDISVYDKYF
jgi:hypothetical protein